VWIHQDAWFHLGHFDKDFSTVYEIKQAFNGIYAFVIKGKVAIESKELNERDGFGIWNIEEVTIRSLTDGAELLLMDIPMKI
jgi:quercetin 2,3-dioxygenase